MIQIQIKKDLMHNVQQIDVSGHADYAPHGQDIVCAAVSTLLQVVGYSLTEREETLTYTNFEKSGLGIVNIGNPTRESYLITSVFEYGATMLANQYPDHIKLEMM